MEKGNTDRDQVFWYFQPATRSVSQMLFGAVVLESSISCEQELVRFLPV